MARCSGRNLSGGTARNIAPNKQTLTGGTDCDPTTEVDALAQTINGCLAVAVTPLKSVRFNWKYEQTRSQSRNSIGDLDTNAPRDPAAPQAYEGQLLEIPHKTASVIVSVFVGSSSVKKKSFFNKNNNHAITLKHFVWDSLHTVRDCWRVCWRVCWPFGALLALTAVFRMLLARFGGMLGSVS